MKKIIALVVAVLMMAAIAVPAFAEGETVATSQINNNTNAGTAEVTFGFDEAYIVSIPQTIAFGTNLEASAVITATGVKIAGNKTLQVTVSSTNYVPAVKDGEEVTEAAKWQMIDQNKDGQGNPASDNVPYMIAVNTTEVVSGSTVVLEVSSGDDLTIQNDKLSGTTKSATLNFSTLGTSQVGRYKDTLTFTTVVADPTTQA